MNGINASVWNDLSFDEADEARNSPIVLIAKPFTKPILTIPSNSELNEMNDNVSSNNKKSIDRVMNFNQTDDYFLRLMNNESNERSKSNSMRSVTTAYEPRFITYKFANFRKRFFSKLLSF
ncbi:hypothetical protein RDWZM_001386 [Blomia tropicalis]|uniref:Uncharacterized protein n=1 Tax=Blomia tropicalis TaxID=40697 RepID=A0A9Q0MBG1_BLOTA|nr:hypothetical protein RDWZM_001386 [Blomia tropicalis]